MEFQQRILEQFGHRKSINLREKKLHTNLFIRLKQPNDTMLFSVRRRVNFSTSYWNWLKWEKHIIIFFFPSLIISLMMMMIMMYFGYKRLCIFNMLEKGWCFFEEYLTRCTLSTKVKGAYNKPSIYLYAHFNSICSLYFPSLVHFWLNPNTENNQQDHRSNITSWRKSKPDNMQSNL